MNNHALLACAATTALAACAAAPDTHEPVDRGTIEAAPAAADGPESGTVPGTGAQAPAARDWPYQPPTDVNEIDASECARRAEDAAYAAIANMGDSNVGVLFGAVGGAIGAIVQVTRAKRKMNGAYEKTFVTCLRERGYEP